MLALDQARIRLEGALERLEAMEPKLGDLHALLGSPQWKTELLETPERLDAVARSAVRLEQDLESARRLHARTPCPELAEQLGRIATLTDQLRSLARGHGARGDSLALLLEDTRARARAELPAPLEQGEQVVRTTTFSKLRWLGGIVTAGSLGAGGMFLAWAHPAVLMGCAAVVVASAMAALVSSSRSAGQVMLTTRRILIRPKGADPVEVRLSELPAGAMKVSAAGTTLELGTPRRLRVTGVPNGVALATEIELERWLSGRTAAPPDATPRWRALWIPSGNGDASSPSAPTLLLMPDGYAVLPVAASSDVRHSLNAILGTLPRVPIPFDAFCRALRRLDPVDAERTLGVLAAALHTDLVRRRRVLRQRGFANRFGFESGHRVIWFEPSSYALVSEAHAFLADWEHHEAAAEPMPSTDPPPLFF